MLLLITFDPADAAAAADRNSDLLVCARFESTTTAVMTGAGGVVTAMIPGSTVALPAAAIVQPELEMTESDWIRAEKASRV